MTKQEFQAEIRNLQNQGTNINEIADELGYSTRTIRRAISDKWEGDSSRVFKTFELEYFTNNN